MDAFRRSNRGSWPAANRPPHGLSVPTPGVPRRRPGGGSGCAQDRRVDSGGGRPGRPPGRAGSYRLSSRRSNLALTLAGPDLHGQPPQLDEALGGFVAEGIAGAVGGELVMYNEFGERRPTGWHDPLKYRSRTSPLTYCWVSSMKARRAFGEGAEPQTIVDQVRSAAGRCRS